MQIVENWSRVVGRVEAWSPPSSPDEWGELQVRVERVGPTTIDGKAFPHLVDVREGQRLTVRVPAKTMAALFVAEGDDISVDVRRGRDPGHVFAHPEQVRISKPR